MRLPAFRRLWLGLLLSRLGDQFTTIALLWFVLELTGSGLALGAIILAFNLPTLLSGPPLGRLLDRAQPRLVMATDNAARACVIGAIPLLHRLGALDLGRLLALAIVAGILAPATRVGTLVLLPHLVPDEELEAANAFLSVGEGIAALAGPAVAGLLVGLLGAPAVILIDAFSFGIMGLLLLGLPTIMPGVPGASRGTGRGFGTLLRRADLRALTAIAFVFFLAYGPLEPAVPVYSRETLGAGATGYGLLWGAFGAGALLGLPAIRPLARLARPGIVLAGIAIGWGLLLLPGVIVARLPVALVGFILAGCVWAPFTAIETATLQRLVPPAERGALFGARGAILAASAPLGVFVGGLLLERLSAPATIAVSAAACIVAGGAGLASPALRRLQ